MGKAGYQFGSGWRLEAEYGYRNGGIWSIDRPAILTVPRPADRPLRGGRHPNRRGADLQRATTGILNVQSVMANVIYEIPVASRTIDGARPSCRSSASGSAAAEFVSPT
jgi:hypothetical protein